MRTCLTMKTVTVAVAMKTPTATNERTDRRERPQMPWPDVQPRPTRVPMPTSRPAPTSQTGGSVIAGSVAGTSAKTAGAEREAEPGADRQADEEDDAPEHVAARGREDVAGDGGDAGGAAVDSHSSVAASPMSRPPTVAESGAKFSMVLNP